MRRRLKQVIQHVVLWLVVLLFYTTVFDVGNSLFSSTLYFSLFLMPVTIGTTYISIYKLIPDYLVKKRYLRFSIYAVYTLIISVFAICLSIFFGLAYLSDFQLNTVNTIGRSALFIMTCIYLVVIIVSALKLFNINILQSKNNALLESKFLATKLKLKEQELKYLKMQIHPHFLFNTLNTMYGFALQKAEETPEMILKLSNLLDYLLYQADKPTVNIMEEVNHIEDYISLEQLRFNETLDVNFSREIRTNTTEIAPMLFIPFVENSFKHGTLQNGILKINISILSDSNYIHFKISNSQIKHSENTSGIGLENIKKRLELIYPNQYELNITNNDDRFSVDFKLNIKQALANE